MKEKLRLQSRRNRLQRFAGAVLTLSGVGFAIFGLVENVEATADRETYAASVGCNYVYDNPDYCTAAMAGSSQAIHEAEQEVFDSLKLAVIGGGLIGAAYMRKRYGYDSPNEWRRSAASNDALMEELEQLNNGTLGPAPKDIIN